MSANLLLSVVLVLWFPFEVLSIKSTSYIGTLNVTINRIPCQDWKSDSPHKHDYKGLPGNYCRDPSSSNFLWCYTKDPKVRWDICDPRELIEVQPYQTVLFNTTGSNCIQKTCCNITLETFKNFANCNPEMFVQLLFFYHMPNKSGNVDVVSFEKKYIVSKYFNFTLSTNARSKLDCAYQCLKKPKCNGFTYKNEDSNKSCNAGEFINPDAIKFLSDFIGDASL